MDFGRNMARVRKEKGLTQEYVSERTCVSIAFLSKIERGMKIPTLPMALEIADALGVSILDLVAKNDA